MIVGMITIGTCYGDVDIPVQLIGKGPRPETVWVKALGGLQPFTKISHGGPYQDDTIIFSLPMVRNVHLEREQDNEQSRKKEEKTKEEASISAPDQNISTMDWTLERSYENRTTGG